jgi:metal regulatory transcription factor 1
MVKHQRRSHQRGVHSSELDDCTSESGSEDSPSTPKSSAMQWPHTVGMLHGHHPLHRAASFADFGYGMQQPHQQAQQPFHRHSLSSSGAHEYHHAMPMHPHEQQVAAHHAQQQQQQQQQHPVHMLQRTASLPQHNYYVTEQSNPGVATMNTNPHAVAVAAAAMPPQFHAHHHQHQPPTHQIPRQSGVDRLPLDIPSFNQPPQLAGSIQSSPSSFSAASAAGRSPSTQEGFYTHAAPATATQAATYALHTASPVEQQVATFPHQQQHSQQPTPVSQQPTPQPTQEAFQHAPPPPPQAQPQEDSGWYGQVPYQPPVEAVTIGSMPAYGTVSMYETWGGPKLEFEDTGIQMPSARIENM